MSDGSGSVGPSGILGALVRAGRSAMRGLTVAAFQAELKRAQELVSRGDYAGAQERLEDLTKLGKHADQERPWQATGAHLHQAVALAVLSDVYQVQGMHDRARSAAAEAVEAFGTLDLAAATAGQLEWYATVLHRLDRRKEALEILREAYRRNEDPVRLAPRLADWLAEAGEPSEAADVLLATAARHQASAADGLALAEALERHGQGAAAAEAFADAGIALQMSGRLAESRDALGRAWRLQPEQPALASAYAVALAPEDPAAAQAVLDFSRERGGEDADLHLAQATVFRAQGKDDEALRELDRAEELSPGHPALPGARGYLYYLQGRYDQAATQLRQAVALAPEPDASLLTLLGDALRRQQDLEEAEDLLLEAVRLAPAHSEARAALVRTELQLGNLDEASRLLWRAPSVDVLLARAHGEVAEKFRLGGKYDAALRHIDVALRPEFRGDPGFGWRVGTRGQIFAAQGRRSAAIADLVQAVTADPSLRWALAELQQVLSAVDDGERDRALATLHSALVAHPGAPPNWRAQLLRCEAQLRQDRGEFAAAAAALATAVELDGSDADLWAELGENWRMAGDLDRGLPALDEALRLDETHDFARGSRGAARASLGDLDGAEEDLRAVLDRDPDYTWAAAQLGDVLVAKGRHHDAVAEFARVLTLEPRNVAVRRSLGYALLESDRPYDALSAFQQALEVSPDNLVILNDLAWVHAALEDYPSALAVVDQALGLDPEDLSTLDQKAALLNELGEYEEALPLLDRLLKKDRSFADAHFNRGWALANCGGGRAEEARKAYARALRLGESPMTRKEYANCLRALGRPAARTHYRRALQALLDDEVRNADLLAAAGWCCYGLKRYDEALRYYDEAQRKRRDVATQLDVALAQLCRGDGAAADEYRRGLERVGRQWPRRQRGLLRVALTDLEEARQALTLDEAAVRVCEEKVAAALQALGTTDGAGEPAATGAPPRREPAVTAGPAPA